MATTLNTGRLIRTSVFLSPVAAQRRGFGTLLVAGDSDVINGYERIRSYTTIEQVVSDFGTSAPEYDAAVAYFGQTPKPATLMIGRWISAATSGFMRGGVLTTGEQAMANFTVINAGVLSITVDGTVQAKTGIDFSAQTTLSGVAAVLTTKYAGIATFTWDGSRFVVTSDTTGASSSVDYVTTGIASLLKLDSANASAPIPGYAAETPLECVTTLADISNLWFGLTFSATETVTDDDHVAIAGFIEAATVERVYGVTSQDTAILDPLDSGDIASRLKDLSYNRSFVQYSSSSTVAAASFMGRAFSVNFNANRSTITLMYKQEPGITGENLTETQAQTLKSKNCNVFAKYDNDTVIIQYGTMASGAYFDEIHGLSWFKDALQNAEYNLLYQSKTKIPQTDSGQNQLIATAASVCKEALNNGLIASGTWNADGFGQLSTGDTIPGYYIYTPPIALQDQSIRETRTAPPLQIALKLAGAFQELDIIVDVNR